MAIFRGIAAHSDCHIFFLYQYLSVTLVVSQLDAVAHDHSLLFTLDRHCYLI